ncbi:hypothetical protein BS47DRAFT_1348504 [Hydnum rufescens UP504]|uniref:Uncharacterized protein n=1 Tax=Hydnum rufescens UP504 TaxID=1448309 RepID=A0A9P6AQC6_9AGAM|nr:hypothetical protein BS47DRAFT_1348504 [Hydnum rufescens UP504]
MLFRYWAKYDTTTHCIKYKSLRFNEVMPIIALAWIARIKLSFPESAGTTDVPRPDSEM